MMQTFTLRIRESWLGQLDSAQTQGWLVDYLRQPYPLPDDPGPGDERVSLSLPRRPVKVLAALLDCRPSAALRRLAADRIGYLPQGSLINVLPAAHGNSTGREIVLADRRTLVGSNRGAGDSALPFVPGAWPPRRFASFEQFRSWRDASIARPRGSPLPAAPVRLGRRWLAFGILAAAAAVFAFLWTRGTSAGGALARAVGQAGWEPWVPEV